MLFMAGNSTFVNVIAYNGALNGSTWRCPYDENCCSASTFVPSFGSIFVAQHRHHPEYTYYSQLLQTWIVDSNCAGGGAANKALWDMKARVTGIEIWGVLDPILRFPFSINMVLGLIHCFHICSTAGRFEPVFDDNMVRVLPSNVIMPEVLLQIFDRFHVVNSSCSPFRTVLHADDNNSYL